MPLKTNLVQSILQNSKIPKWLKVTGKDFSQREALEIDSLEEDGTALNTAPSRPPYKFKVYKKVKRRLAEMEELHEWVEKKSEQSDLDDFIDNLESTLNSMT